MKKQFILLICVLSGYIGYAQQGIDVLDFIKNAPWDLTKSEIDAKYENYKFELADSVKTLIPNNFITLGDNIFSGFQLGKYNGFTCYMTDGNTGKPRMFIIFVDPTQTVDTDEKELIQYTDSLLYAKLGEPFQKQENYTTDDGDRGVMRFWTDQTTAIISTVVRYNSQPEKPLVYLITLVNADDGSNDFRIARWGDSMSQIIDREGRKNEWTGQEINPNVYSFSSSIANKLCDVLYFFTTNDKLTRSKYYFTNVSTDGCISDYKELVSLLSEKYGEPIAQSREWADPSYEKTCKEEGYEVYMGRLSYYTYWTTIRSRIIISLKGGDSLINFGIEYSSSIHEQEAKEDRLRGL